jgi:hypothetical protein
MTPTTDQERIALLEKRVADLERMRFSNPMQLYGPTTPPYQNGRSACEYGKRPCNCILGHSVVT